MAAMVPVGSAAPDFILPKDGGGTISLREYRGRKLVVYFYPKANTSGCTKEAIAFNRLKPAFDEAETAILGVSADRVAAVEKFKQKYTLGFLLASDETFKMLQAYGVWSEKSIYGRTFLGITRATYLIDRKGLIAKLWPKVRVEGHAEEVLAAATAL